MWLGILVFFVTYVLVSARRLGWLKIDRPTGALAGAVACVLVGLVTPEQAIAAVDGRTLLLLFGMMGMGAFLGVDGFFDRAGLALAHWARTPARLLGGLVWASGTLSALITNDAVCVLGAPLVVILIKRYRLPPLPFLLALATSANTGSVATLVGNPQNMLCGILGDLSYLDHLLLAAPVAAIGLAINHGLLWILFRKELHGKLRTSPSPDVLTSRSATTLAVIGGVAVLYTLGTDLAWTAAGGCTALLLAHRRSPDEIWSRIDWSILLFFAALFIVVEGFANSGAPAWLFQRFPLWQGEGTWGWLRVAAIFLLGSNIVSNVPFILVVRDQMATLPDPRLGWEMLAMASTFAGNLTLLGSVANIIVAQKGKAVGGMGFWQYLRLGLPLSLVTTLLGALWLIWVG
ncbi:MAG: hypothetical protein JW797_02260 [Bradymonadales bacterium]|nr:hypothetical protein [Bradymonadales bacterium]